MSERIAQKRFAFPAGILESFGVSGAIQGANIITGVLLARSLGLHGRGELAAIVLWPSMLAAVGSLGIADAVTFHAARTPRRIGAIVGTGLVLGLAESIGLMCLGVVVLPLVLGHDGGGVVALARWFLFFIPLN